jgi:hypothetical protein
MLLAYIAGHGQIRFCFSLTVWLRISAKLLLVEVGLRSVIGEFVLNWDLGCGWEVTAWTTLTLLSCLPGSCVQSS